MDADKRCHTNRLLTGHLGVANQYGEKSRQYNLIGGGSQKIVEGQYFMAQGNQHFDTPWSMPSKNTPNRQPPPYKKLV